MLSSSAYEVSPLFFVSNQQENPYTTGVRREKYNQCFQVFIKKSELMLSSSAYEVSPLFFVSNQQENPYTTLLPLPFPQKFC